MSTETEHLGRVSVGTYLIKRIRGVMLSFKKALIDNDEERFFKVLRCVMSDWYLWSLSRGT